MERQAWLVAIGSSSEAIGPHESSHACSDRECLIAVLCMLPQGWAAACACRSGMLHLSQIDQGQASHGILGRQLRSRPARRSGLVWEDSAAHAFHCGLHAQGRTSGAAHARCRGLSEQYPAEALQRGRVAALKLFLDVAEVRCSVWAAYAGLVAAAAAAV